MEEFPSGQRGQTVNLLLFSFDGPNPSSSTKVSLNANCVQTFSFFTACCPCLSLHLKCLPTLDYAWMQPAFRLFLSVCSCL